MKFRYLKVQTFKRSFEDGKIKSTVFTRPHAMKRHKMISPMLRNRDSLIRAGEIIREVEGTRPWGPSRKRVPKYLKGPKTTYTTIAIAEKTVKKVKRAHFVIYCVPPGPSQEMELVGPGGEGRSRPPPPGFSSHAHNFEHLSTLKSNIFSTRKLRVC